MYNEKTRQEGALYRQAPMTMPQRRSSNLSRDLPELENRSQMQSRRRCDGSLVEPRLGMSRMGEDRSDNRMGARAEHQQAQPSGRCGGWGLDSHPLAMVYSPCQAFKGLYAIDVALSRGTLFSELDLPFEPNKCRRGL